MTRRYGQASKTRETAALVADGCGPQVDADDDSDPVHPLGTAYAARLRRLADAAPRR